MTAERISTIKEGMTDRQKAAALDYLTGAMDALGGRVVWEQMVNALEYGKSAYPNKEPK